MSPAIELIAINKRFGEVHANKDVNLAVERGTIHGIVGENGAGKSTLMSILYGFYEADSGEIRVDGKPVSDPLAGGRHRAPASAWCTSTSCWSSRSPWSRTSCSAPRAARFCASARRRCGPSSRGLSRDYGLEIDVDATRRRSVGRPAAARRDPEGALSRRRHPHPRRADRRADAAGGRRPVRAAAGAEGAGQDGHPHHPQAARDHGGHRPGLGHAPRRDGGDPRDRRHLAAAARRADGRPARAAARREERARARARPCSRSRTCR